MNIIFATPSFNCQKVKERIFEMFGEARSENGQDLSTVIEADFHEMIGKFESTRHNVRGVYLKKVSHLSYVAVDFNERIKTSFITAKHLIYNKGDERPDHYYVTTYPGEDLYEEFLEHINSMLNQG